MKFQWPWRRSRNREPVTGIESRLQKAMGDHVVSGLFGPPSLTLSASELTEDPTRDVLDRLVSAAFDARRKAMQGPARNVVVEPAVPVLYLGDRNAYLSSPRRILTVGLNPLPAEFPAGDAFKRFPLASKAEGPGDDYLGALDTYFKTASNSDWFSAFEALLHGIDASYYPGARCTALHTFLCSPVATDPAWSKLDATVSDQLASEGVTLWHELVRCLRPHLMLISIARRHLERIGFHASEPFQVSRLEGEGRSRPYVAEGRWLDIDGHQSLMVFGTASQHPFGLVAHARKLEIGSHIAGYLSEGESQSH